MPTKATKAAKTAKPMWTLEQGLELVRRLQPETRQFNYHLAIGGGVVNKGSSTKDLDLYLIPLDNDLTDFAGLMSWLRETLGSHEPIGRDYGNTGSAYRIKLKFDNDGQRIDVFVIRG